MSRYSIYDVIGKRIRFKNKGELIDGICDDVKREVLDNRIVFTVKGKEYGLSDPNKIETDGNKLILVYGTEQAGDLVDFCGEEYSVRWGEDIRKSIGREKSFLRIVIEIGENEKANSC